MADGEGGTGESASGAPQSFSIDEFDKGKADQKPDLTKVIVDDDGLPADLKGKSVAEVVAAIKSRDSALRLSESARQQAELTAQALARSPQAPAPVAQPEVRPEPEMPADELAQLMTTDPAKAVEVITRQVTSKMKSEVDSRLGPLANGAAGVAEQNARSKYPDEFQLFGDEIKKFVDALPNKSALSNPAAWDDLVSYVRGKSGNFEKLFDHRAGKTKAEHLERAQQVERETSGFTARPANTQAPSRRGNTMDSTEQEIAREMGLSNEEYIRWRNI